MGKMDMGDMQDVADFETTNIKNKHKMVHWNNGGNMEE